MKTRYPFTTIQGNPFPAVHPIGQDPLLARWRAGDFATHPRWLDPAFWYRVARNLAAIERGIARNRLTRSQVKND